MCYDLSPMADQRDSLDGYTNNEGLRWFRMPGESRKAYEAFTVYRDLGPARSLRLAAEKVGKDISLIKKWSSKWGWVDRADSFDKNEEVERMWDMRARRIQWLEQDLQATERMQEKIRQRLETLDPKNLTPSQLIRWYDVISRRQEKILGITPEQLEEQLASQASGESDLERLMDSDEGIRDAVIDYFSRRDSEETIG